MRPSTQAMVTSHESRARTRAPLASFHPIVQRWFTDELGDADAGAARGLGGDPRRPAHADCRADRVGQDAGGVPHRARRPAAGGPRAAAAGRGARRLRLAAQGAEQRHPQEPRRAARRASGGWPRRWASTAPRITAAVRTGDTPQAERAAMLRKPPHILVTTPESLYLLLTAGEPRACCGTVRTVIVDEIHAVIGTRRGAHLALSLERLAARQRASAAADRPLGHAAADRGGRALPGWIGERRRRRARRLRRRRRRPSPRDRPGARAAADRRSRR